MNETPGKRSAHVWVAIALTLALAAYFGWQVLEALLVLAAAGVSKDKYAAYIPAGIFIFVFLVSAFAVYRGYRWSLFLYQLGVVLAGVQLLLLAPGYPAVISALLGSPHGFGPMEQGLLLTLMTPVVAFAAVLYCAIVVYWKIYSVRREED